jgi:PhnB protein
MAQVNPYLNFNGNTEEAFNFYKSVFGGDFAAVVRFKDMGPAAGPVPPEAGNLIMHIALPIGNGNMLMATDAVEAMGQKVVEGNNHYLSLSADSKEEADRLYNSLSAGGKIEMAIGDVPWGSYFGMFKDKFGTQWMVSYDKPRV